MDTIDNYWLKNDELSVAMIFATGSFLKWEKYYKQYE